MKLAYRARYSRFSRVYCFVSVFDNFCLKIREDRIFCLPARFIKVFDIHKS